MLKLSICVVLNEPNRQYIDYLHTISPYFDEVILITNNEWHEVDINNAIVRTVDDITLNTINDCISNINGDWFLWLHEGEQIDAQDIYRLRDWVYEMRGKIGLVQAISARQSTVGQFKSCDAAAPRLLKKGTRFSYYSSYFELLDYEHIMEESDISCCGIKIYGANEQFTINNDERLTQKSFQALEQLALKSDSPYLLYQYGIECYRGQKFSRAVKALNQAIFLLAAKQEVPADYLYKLKYASLIEIKHDEETLRGLGLVLQIYPNHTELMFYSAFINYKLKRYKQARQQLFACLTQGEQRHLLCKKGVGSYIASFYIGLCYEKEGEHKLALQYYQNALIVNPTYKAANRAAKRLMYDAFVINT